MRHGRIITLLVLLCGQSEASEDPWHLVPIPETWKSPPGGDLAPQSGYAWYRCIVVIPAAWEGKTLQLFMEPLDDARQAYVNGTLVGAAGTFPPLYRSGLAEPSRHRIPARSVRPGEHNTVAVRVHVRDGRTNFSVAAPIILAGDEAIRMEGTWQYRPGDDMSWATVSDGSETPELGVFSTVDTVEDVASYVARRKGDHNPLPPAAALARFQVADDLAVDLVLAEPDISQPLFLSFDERGRLWVLEYRQYPEPAGLKMVSRDKHLRSVYDRSPPPPPHHDRGRDRISIHEDSDGDGTPDRHTIFIDGLNIATSFARGRGGVWVLNPPYLLFYADEDRDDVPDGDPVVHLEGFGIEDSHSVVSNLRWGPDGWLYAAQGSTVTGKVRRPGANDKPVHSMGQLIWRYHPETRRYEIFGEGGGNTFGVEIDSRGRIFSGTNGGDARGFHYVQGGYSRKGFAKHGALSNPYTFGYFEDMEHESAPRFTHTFVIYEDDALPEPYRGKLLGLESLQGQIVLSEISPDRSSFRTHDISRPVATDDRWFRPVDIKVGPDGALYVADFYEQRIDHSSHYAGRIDRTNGRVYRIRARTAAPAKPVDISALSGGELVEILGRRNRTVRQEALRLLGDRRDAGLIPDLCRLLRERRGQFALETLWALHLVGGLTDVAALDLLDHADPFVRLWTVRLVCDRRSVTPQITGKLAAMAALEPHVEVRSQLACSARRLRASGTIPVVRELLGHAEDVDDIHLPLLLWWALEAKIARTPDAVLELFEDPAIWRLPLVQEHILERLMRRLATTGSRRELLACARLLRKAPDLKHSETLLRGFEKAFRGRPLAGLPDELVAAMVNTGGGSPALRLRRGDPDALTAALATAVDDAADPETRSRVLRILGEIQQPRCVPALLAVVRDSGNSEIRRAAFAALQSYSDTSIGTVVTRIHGQLPEDLRDAAENLLATRASWALELLRACDRGAVDTAAVAPATLRRILLHDDAGLAKLIRKHWGEIEGSTTLAMHQEIQRVTGILGTGSGNPYGGEKLFVEKCGTCHTMFAQGGAVGPDLTTYDRDDVERMLLGIINPSAEIREGYENHLVVTTDGRVLNGFLLDRDPQVVILRGVDGQNTIVQRQQIISMRAIPRSLMPEAVLTGLSDQQVRDLFAYLRSTQPLP